MPKRRKVLLDLEAGDKPRKRALVRMPRHQSLEVYARAVGGKAELIELARHSDDKKMSQVVDLWDSLCAYDQKRTPVEDLCLKVGITQDHFIGLAVEAGSRFCIDVSQLVLAAAQPKLTTKLIELAMKPKGAKHMEMALKAAGRFPMPAGHQVNLYQKIGGSEMPAPAVPQAPSLPTFESEAMIDAEFERS